jgi:hypothetical protein
VEISVLPIAEFSSNGEHVAGIADTKACLVQEMDGEVQDRLCSMVAVPRNVDHLNFRVLIQRQPKFIFGQNGVHSDCPSASEAIGVDMDLQNT